MDLKTVEHPIGVFRCELPFVMLVGIVTTLPIAQVIILCDNTVNVTIPSVLMLTAEDAILVGVGFGLVVAYYKIYIYSNQIYGYNFWGKYHHLAWSDVERISPIGLLGVKYIRVYSRRNTKVMWIPLFLKDLDRFVNLVCLYAGPDNALVQYFKNIGMVPDVNEGRESKGK